MNILLVAEKPSITKYFKDIIEKHKDEFPNNYYFDYVRNITHFDDDVLRMCKKNGVYYLLGRPENIIPLTLKSYDIPLDTFLEFQGPKFAYQPNIDVSKMDMIISICDTDDCGCMAFRKYLEIKGIKEAYVYKYYSLEENELYELLKENRYIKEEEYFNETIERLKNNNFAAQWPRDTNVAKLRKFTRMNRKEFANYFGIPYRTLENWEKDSNKVPKYLYDLMEYKLTNENLIYGLDSDLEKEERKKNNIFIKGKKVHINLRKLYEKGIQYLEHGGEIKHQIKNGKDVYDLFQDGAENFHLLHNEEDVEIFKVNENDIIVIKPNNEYCKLWFTIEEFKIAVINE